MRRIILFLTLMAVASCGGDPRPSAVVTGKDAAKILESTPWLDRAPEKESDVIHAWIFPRGEGVYFVGNAYKGSYELFRYFVEDDELRVKFHDGGDTHKVHFRIERIEDRVFDYKLTLEPSPRGPVVYYGMHQGRDVPPAARALLEALPR